MITFIKTTIQSADKDRAWTTEQIRKKLQQTNLTFVVLNSFTLVWFTNFENKRIQTMIAKQHDQSRLLKHFIEFN